MDRRHFLTASASLIAMPTSAAENGLSSYLQKELGGTDFSGTILIRQRGTVALRQGYGQAERSFQIPCDPTTCFRIASITKLFTSTLIMQLVDAGRIGLDQPIKAYLPEYKGPAAGQVLIRQLLNHTSGIENFGKGLVSYADAASRGMPAYQLPHTPRELMDRFASGPLVHAPGTTFDYNNGDYVILGQIVEAVEGAPYDVVLNRRLLKPLGLSATTMATNTAIVPKLAPTYYKDGAAALVADMPVYAQNWYAAGGLCSTCDDLLAFAQALYSGRLISPASLKTLLTPGLEEYGYGLWISTLDVNGHPHRFAQRPGRIMGANSLLLHMLDDDITIIVLGNTNLVDTDRLGFRIARQLLS